MIYTIKIRRDARCMLEAEIQVKAGSQEQAEQKALYQSEEVLTADDFTVTSIDLSACEGSSEVVDG